MIGIQQRLAIAHVCAIVLVLGLAAFGGYFTLVSSVRGQLDAALLALAETEQGLLPEAPGQPIVIHDVNQGMAPSFIRLDRLVQIIDDRGRPLARSANLGSGRLPAPSALVGGGNQAVFETLDGYGEEPVRMVSLPIRGHAPVRAIQVAGSLDDVNNVIHTAGLLFLAMGVALLLGLSISGTLITRRAFASMDLAVQQAQSMGDRDLSRRLPHPGTRDEVGRLVDTLNAMLERIERGVEVQRRFTADAAHELRSPLSRLRVELDLATRRPRTSAEYGQVLDSCLDEVVRLTHLVDELLALARVDAGLERPTSEPTRLQHVVTDVLQRSAQLAAERNIRLEASDSVDVTARIGAGSAGLVVSNLVENAIKFSPPLTTVIVRLRENGSAIELSVLDRGPGVSPEDVDHLFDRFYRGRSARATGADGQGLGLAVCRAIVRAHGGEISVHNQPGGGAAFVVRLPRDPAEAAPVPSSEAGPT